MQTINFRPSDNLSTEVKSLLNSTYNENRRAYHTTDHINQMLEDFDSILIRYPEISRDINYDTMRLAIIFHDIIQFEENNEELSAKISGKLLYKINYISEWVQYLILATRYDMYRSYNDLSLQLIRDLDLKNLALSTVQYEYYSYLVRKEFKDISAEEWKKGRISFLEKLLSFPKIYQSSYFSYLEETARKNIRNEIEELNKNERNS